MSRRTNWMQSTSSEICFAALILLLMACGGSDSSSKTDPEVEKNFDESVAQLSTPEILSDFMLDEIPYTSGSQRDDSRVHGHSWKTPEETFDDGYGYCYDLSAFALYCLLEHGYEDAKLMFTCFGDWGNESSSGHFVAYFKRNNSYWTINNGNLNGPFSSLTQVINDASFGRYVDYHRTFTYEQIPFHTAYRDMDYFCDSN